MGCLRVRVRIGAGLSHLVKGAAEQVLQLAPGARVQDAVDILGLPLSAVGIISRNGTWAQRDDGLEDGDELELYPFVSGG